MMSGVQDTRRAPVAQGRSASSWAASESSVASSSGRPTSCTDSGRPSSREPGGHRGGRVAEVVPRRAEPGPAGHPGERPQARGASPTCPPGPAARRSSAVSSTSRSSKIALMRAACFGIAALARRRRASGSSDPSRASWRMCLPEPLAVGAAARRRRRCRACRGSRPRSDLPQSGSRRLTSVAERAQQLGGLLHRARGSARRASAARGRGRPSARPRSAASPAASRAASANGRSGGGGLSGARPPPAVASSSSAVSSTVRVR